MIASMSKTGELKELKKDVEQTEDYDMCKAIDMMMQEREERGEARGIETDRNIFRLYRKGYNQQAIADTLNISLERVKDFLDDDEVV